MGLKLSKSSYDKQPANKDRYVLELFGSNFDKADFNPTIISPYKCSNYKPKLKEMNKILYSKTKTSLDLYRPNRIEATFSGGYCSLMFQQSQKWKNSLIFAEDLLKNQKIPQKRVVHTVVKKQDGLKYALIDERNQGWLASCANDELSIVDTNNRKKLLTVGYRSTNNLQKDAGFFVQNVKAKERGFCFYELVLNK